MENLYSKKRGLEDNCYSAEQHLLLLLESSLNEARQQVDTLRQYRGMRRQSQWVHHTSWTSNRDNDRLRQDSLLISHGQRLGNYEIWSQHKEVQINSSEDLTTAGGLLVAVDKFLSTGEKSSTLS